MHFKIKDIKGHKYLYLIQNKRVDGKVKQVKQICVGTPQKVYDIISKNMDLKIASFSFGKPAALLKAAEEVGLVDSINKRINRKNMVGFTPAQYLLTIIMGRAEHKYSRNRLDEYFNDSVLKFFWHPKHKLNSQNFLNYMKKLDEETIYQIENDVAKNLVNLGYIPSRLIFDTTNYYTHIQHGEELPKKGSSKEKRYDKNLIGFGMTISNDNLPFHSFTYPANNHDVKVFSGIIGAVSKRLKDINVPSENITMIIDRGMLSEDNVDIVLQNMHIVGSLPSSMAKNLYSIPLSEYEEELKYDGKTIIKAHGTSGIHYGKKLALALTYNEKTARKQKREWMKNKKKILLAIEDVKKTLNRNGPGRKMSAKGLINKVADILQKQYRGLFNYSAIEVDGTLELKFELLEEKEKIYISSFGKTVIFTDNTLYTTKELVEIYSSRNIIEDDYKWMKDKLVLPLKPMFLRKDCNIRAHVFLCVMGLLLYNYLLLKIDETGMTPPKLSEKLDKIRLILVSRDAKHAEFVIEELNKESAKIFNKLNLEKYIPQ